MSAMTLPQPPLALARRTGGLAGRPDPLAAYDTVGAESKVALLRLLPAAWPFAGKRVLDFGCGAGATLRHFLPEAESAEFWGADIDTASIAWLQANLSPPLRAMRNRPDPPLGLEHGTFDLIWALSVFTHLTDRSLDWLVELHQLLKPGGLLAATYMGRWNGEIFTGEPWDEDRVGMNVLRRDQGWDDGGPIVLMSDWWLREHWGRAFNIVGVVPEFHWQTLVLLEKRDVRVTPADLARPSDDPREFMAVRHNVVQVERDRQRALDELRGYYEGSASWRLTRPLRDTTRAVRALRDRSGESRSDPPPPRAGG
jgi:SAM-dependent methyltransferase